MTLQHKLKRLFEQPTILLEELNGIYPTHAFNVLKGKEIIGNFSMLIDVGSNKGDFTRAFKFYNPSSKCILFEPLSEFNNDVNKINNIHFLNMALSNTNKITKFYVNPKQNSQSSLSKSLLHRTVAVNVACRRFDKLNIKILRPCYLKIDVEGNEFNVLKGFGNKLNFVDFIQVEYLFRKEYIPNYLLGDLFSYLPKFGFNCFMQTGITYTDNDIKRLDKCDLLFWRQKK